MLKYYRTSQSAVPTLKLYGCRLPGERTDVWIMRYADTAEMNLWGLAQMDPGLVSKLRLPVTDPAC